MNRRDLFKWLGSAAIVAAVPENLAKVGTICNDVALPPLKTWNIDVDQNWILKNQNWWNK